jgi:hypothetical protein
LNEVHRSATAFFFTFRFPGEQVRAVERHGGFNARMVNDDNISIVNLAAGEHRVSCSTTGSAKILLIIKQSSVLKIKKATEVAFLDQFLISTYLEM